MRGRDGRRGSVHRAGPGRLLLAGALAVGAVGLTCHPAVAQGNIELVSRARRGVSGGGRSGGPALSRDGRTVAFFSDAPDLVTIDLNHRRDVFVLDRGQGKIELVSRATDGGGADDHSQGDGLAPGVSANGRFVAFSSRASNLVPGDGNGTDDVFVRDRVHGVTERVSVGLDGEANGPSSAPALSADGRFVVFQSFASNLVENDTNDTSDIFLFDRRLGVTRRLSGAPDGSGSNGPSVTPAISGNGRVVAFASDARNLVDGDTNGRKDVFVHDRDADEDGVFDEPHSGATSTRRASVGAAGIQADGSSFLPDLSFDGKLVAFKSDASTLVRHDENGRTDVFVRSMSAETTERASVDNFGNEADGPSGAPRISDDGRFVAFPSFSSSLDPTDGNGVADLYVFDRTVEREDGTLGEIRRVAVVRPGVFPTGNVSELPPALSGDGRFVTFVSDATNLVANDINNFADVFLTCSPFDPTGCAPRFPCLGDCDNSGDVGITELVRMVALGLETIVCPADEVAACLAADASCDCAITIDEIVQGVRNALEGCSDFASCSLEELTQACLTERECETEP